MLDSLFVWTGIVIAALDVSRIGRYLDILLESIRTTFVEEIMEKRYPHNRWARAFHNWIMANYIVMRLQLADFGVEESMEKRHVEQHRENREPVFVEGERKFRRIFFTTLFKILLFVVCLISLLPLFVFWFGFYSLLLHLGEGWVQAAIITLALLIFSMAVMFWELADLMADLSLRALGHLYAVLMVALTTTFILPLYPFRKLQAGYMSGMGFLVALAGLL